MKSFFLLSVISLLLSFQTISYAKVKSFFSPFKKHVEDIDKNHPDYYKDAFNVVYEEMLKAKDSISIAIYSWSEHGLEKTLEQAIKNNPNLDIRIVLDAPLPRNSSIKSKIENLEALGVRIKRSTKKMHEKFTIIDNRLVVNTSGNYSSGARYRYSENYVFHYNDGEPEIVSLIEKVKKEFEILWNFSQYTNPNEVEYNYINSNNILPFDNGKLENFPTIDNPYINFYSSSMNFNGKQRNNHYQGSHLGLTIKRNKPWTIRDMILEKINKAKHSIHVCLNHFYIKEIADALIDARKTGVELYLAMDNQEFLYNGIDSDPEKEEEEFNNYHEVTPHLVKRWQDEMPNDKIQVRYKFYSLKPSYQYWFLNHHKYFIIDHGTADAVLISGSYNISETAEHKQFDNMMTYEGEDYAHVIEDFYNEFQNQWYWGRKSGDKVNQSFLDHFITDSDGDGYYPIHNTKAAQSLSHDEAVKFINDYTKKFSIDEINIYGQKNHCLFIKPAKRYSKFKYCR